MNKKFVYGWWLPKEDNHFEDYLSKSIEVGDKRIYQFPYQPKSVIKSHQNGSKKS